MTKKLVAALIAGLLIVCTLSYSSADPNDAQREVKFER